MCFHSRFELLGGLYEEADGFRDELQLVCEIASVAVGQARSIAHAVGAQYVCVGHMSLEWVGGPLYNLAGSWGDGHESCAERASLRSCDKQHLR